MAEIISELKDPISDEVEMSPGSVSRGGTFSFCLFGFGCLLNDVTLWRTCCSGEPNSVNPTPARPNEKEVEEETRKKQMEIAKIRVQVIEEYQLQMFWSYFKSTSR